MILEDDQEVASIVKKYLEIYPAFKKCIIATTNLEASLKLENQSFDLVVSDYQIGKNTSMEFIEKIRNNPKYKNIKVMVVSGCVTEDVAVQLMRLGVRQIQVKPFTAKSLLMKAFNTLGIKKSPEKISALISYC